MSSHEAAFSSESQETQPDISSSIDNVLEDFTDNDEREPNFIDDADKAYIILLNVFQYLPVKDLCSALRVCKVWNRVGSDYVCWKRVNLEDCILHDCNMMGETLKKYGTEILNLSRIRWETNEDSDSESGVDNIMSRLIKTLHNEINEPGRWSSLCNALAAVTTLTEITIVGCPAEAVTLLAEAAPQLKSLSAYRITKGSVLGLTERDSLDVTPIKNIKN